MGKFFPNRCTLQGCVNPGLRPHHHHYVRGHLSVNVCKCDTGGEPGAAGRQCSRGLVTGWGAKKYCTFDEGHKTPCSWEVT